MLRAKGARAAAALCDVSDSASVEAAFGEALATFGRVDGCFANAGVYGSGARSFLERPLEEWRRVMTTNLEGVILTLQAAARHMVERSKLGDAGGRLVVTSSLASLYGTARNEHYAASKAALMRSRAPWLSSSHATASLRTWSCPAGHDRDDGRAVRKPAVVEAVGAYRCAASASRLISRASPLSHERCIVIPHRRSLCDRRRLPLF